MASTRSGLAAAGSLVEPPRQRSELPLLLPYVSRCLAERRFQQPAGRDVFGELLQGTLLFADISGFTALAEQLADCGREGAEELTFLLNDYFEAMVDVVVDHGGDVLQFGGDSLLAVFGPAPVSSNGEAARGDQRPRGSDGPPVTDVFDAVRCGLQMQSAVRRFEHLQTSAGCFRLSMSIAVHRGRFLLASAGSCAGQLQQVVMGRTLNRLAGVESIARPGEVLLTVEAAAKLADRALLGDPREGCVPVLAINAAARASRNSAPASGDSRPRTMKAQSSIERGT